MARWLKLPTDFQKEQGKIDKPSVPSHDHQTDWISVPINMPYISAVKFTSIIIHLTVKCNFEELSKVANPTEGNRLSNQL